MRRPRLGLQLHREPRSVNRKPTYFKFCKAEGISMTTGTLLTSTKAGS